MINIGNFRIQDTWEDIIKRGYMFMVQYATSGDCGGAQRRETVEMSDHKARHIYFVVLMQYKKSLGVNDGRL
jgi:hypothetical protein